MVKEEFLVVGKQKITSNKGNFYAVHVVVKFSEREVSNGAEGRKVATSMVDESEFPNIKIGKYCGYVIQNGRYINLVFDELLEVSP